MSIRRYTTMPTDTVILELEGIIIVDEAPPPVITGLGTGVVGMAGEFLDSPFATPYAAYAPISTQDFLDTFGGYDARVGDSGKEGNGLRALMRRMFAKLVIVRVDMTQAQTLTITRGVGAAGSLAIKAGTEIQNSGVGGTAKKYMTDRTVTWSATELEGTAKTVGVIGIGTVNAGLDELNDWVATDPEAALAMTNPDFATKNNPISSANIDLAYSAALDKLDWGTNLTSDITIVFSARTSSAIRDKLKSHADTNSDGPRGRMAIGRAIYGETQANAQTQAQGNDFKGDRTIYAWPQVKALIPQIDASNAVDTPADSFLAAAMSQLAPERDPAETTTVTQRILSPIVGLEDGAPAMGTATYKSLKANGICAPVFEPMPLGAWFFQSGVTTSLTSGLESIGRRRKADNLQDSMAVSLLPYQKSILTNSLKAAAVGALETYLEEEKNQERIKDYKVDPVSGNTTAREEKGIWEIQTPVKLFPPARNIVLRAQIGETVKILRDEA